MDHQGWGRTVYRRAGGDCAITAIVWHCSCGFSDELAGATRHAVDYGIAPPRQGTSTLVVAPA